MRYSHSTQRAESLLLLKRVSRLTSPRTQRCLDLHRQPKVFLVSASLASPPEIRGVLGRLLLSWPLILHSSQKIATRRTAITNSKKGWLMIALPLDGVAEWLRTPYTQTTLFTSSLAPAFGICKQGFMVSALRSDAQQSLPEGICQRAHDCNDSINNVGM
jgi:hypothetical protein